MITFFILVTVATLIGVAIGTSFDMIEGEK
jgi:hypothetical protein